MENKITTRQYGILIFISIFTSKFLFLPAILYQTAKTNALLSILFLLILDFFVLFICYLYLKKNRRKNFSKIIEQKCGKIIKKTLFFLIFSYFLFKLLTIVSESFIFLRESIFAGAGIQIYLIILFATIIPLAFGALRSFGRTVEFYFYFVLVAVVLCVFLGFVAIGFELPIINIQSGWKEVFKTVFTNSFWFGDSLIAIVLLPCVKVDEQVKKNVFVFPVIAYVLCFAFFISYYGVFDVMSGFHQFGLFDVVAFFPSNPTIGRLDIFPIMLMMFLILFQSALYLRMTMIGLKKSVGIKNDKANMAIVVSIILVLIYFVFDNNESLFLFCQNYLSWLTILVSFLVPYLFAFALRKNTLGARYEKNF